MPESVEDEGRDYKTVNRSAWTRLARQCSEVAQPFDPQQLAEARQWLDPGGWIRWPEIRTVLCLASGGGQQAPMFASLRCHVVSADLCPDQLQRDQQTALQLGFDVECIEADMLDLSVLHGRDFDLVYQAISACYVPDVRQLYREVARVLRPGGYYRVQHWNPVSMQIADDKAWTGRGYELVRPCISGSSYVWRGAAEDGQGDTECWHYIHSFNDLIGGLCDAGLQILRFTESENYAPDAPPGSDEHVHSYAPPFVSIYAQKSFL